MFEWALGTASPSMPASIAALKVGARMVLSKGVFAAAQGGFAATEWLRRARTSRRLADPIGVASLRLVKGSDMQPVHPDAILTRAEVAAWLKLQPRQVDRLGDPCLDLGRKTKRYFAADVLVWLQGKRVERGQSRRIARA